MKFCTIKLYSFNYLAVNILNFFCLKSDIRIIGALNMKSLHIKADITNIKFAHAVNSQNQLSAALNDNTINIIEADVLLGKLNNEGFLLPIMAHPPLESSDLTLSDFLNQIVDHNNAHEHNKKGVKLDFKTTAVFETSLSILSYMIPYMSCPFWLNADIIAGPVNSTAEPVDAASFFAGCAPFNQSIVLSIGWTTEWNAQHSTAGYTAAEIHNMLHAIQKNNVTQNVLTFPVRAGIAVNSKNELKKLFKTLNATHDISLTIWSSKDDFVDVENLRKLILDFGVDRVYLDLPEEITQELNLAHHALESLSSNSTVTTTATYIGGALMISAFVILIIGLWKRNL